MRRKSKCFVCGKGTAGRGHYLFEYLGDEFHLCGSHAQKVAKYIKELEE